MDDDSREKYLRAETTLQRVVVFCLASLAIYVVTSQRNNSALPLIAKDH